MPEGNANQPVEDIFGNVDQAPTNAGTDLPKSPVNQFSPEGGMDLPAPAPYGEAPRSPKTVFSLGIKIIISIVVIIAVAILAAGIYMFFIRDNQSNTNQNTNSVNQIINRAVNKNVNLNQNTNNADQPAANINVNQNLNININVNSNNTNQILDQDKDGLTDAEEEKLGTDPKNIDSDGDGLYDYEEVKIYGTDPLDSDTDNDGYSDGEEVRSGYNPIGSGKIININT